MHRTNLCRPNVAVCPLRSSVRGSWSASTGHPPRRSPSIGPHAMPRCAVFRSPWSMSPAASSGPWSQTPLPTGFGEWQQRQGQQFIDEAVRTRRGGHAGNRPGAGQDRDVLLGHRSHARRHVERGRAWSSWAAAARGHSEALLGSVSSGLVQHAHCPVAVIHDEDPLMPHPAQAPVLVGIDGSPVSELATAIAFDEASRRHVDLIALHAWSDAGVFDFPGMDWSTMKVVGGRSPGRASGGVAGDATPT